jgi:hypothetical protein
MTECPLGPVDRLSEAGGFMVRAGTQLKAHHFRVPLLLDLLQATLFSTLLLYRLKQSIGLPIQGIAVS